MPNYNQTLQSNNIDLQVILSAINELPEASGGVDLPTLTNPAQSEEIFLNKETIDANGNIKVGTFTIDSELSTQNELLIELENILDTKANGSGENEDAIISGEITSYTNDRVKTVGGYALAGRHNLLTVSFPICTNIKTSAFTYCSNLTTANFPVCVNISSYAFYQCRNLKTINFPECTSIDYCAFTICDSLTSVNFPVCTSIGSNAFNGCGNLATISFPICTTISNHAFTQCYKLTSVNFPACTSIYNHAFAICSNLTTVSLPKCTNISSFAFQQCHILSSLILGASSVCILVNSNAFSMTPFLGYSLSFSGTPHIYVPASLVDAYKSATNWVYFSSYITAMEVE